ncbi:acyl-CoA dehydrogenase family protein [Pseudenhygromyxa sp. WMMC2535]|uniref:acyl-CoA dehydrogenase family protein n=1 Tax=Pseudenhygromyxa sp. WMMC2535 TaxID=2712867 RepID=UPI0015563B15|nr:acyl-CoA dehydrogenase family protein [Pseudenhygromyxa sp. WMMC2535]NVB42904.1 acyl-CoA dehydrogenase family protein [Pseudenhygromyxa sp. WMMC2535]
MDDAPKSAKHAAAEPPKDEELSFARQLYFGSVEEDEVFPYPDELGDEERETLQLLLDPLDRFLRERVEEGGVDHDKLLEPELLDELKEMGLFGLQVPEEYGGLGLSNTGYARLFERVAATDSSIAVTLGAHQSIGFKGLMLFGTPEQKQHYLPLLASGELVAAFCLTEPSSGSDAASIRTRARLSEDGEHWILDGSKLWITNGGFADVFTVFAQTEVEIDGQKKDRITAFFVERAFGGVESGPEEHKLGIKGSSTTPIHFDGCKVPKANVLGEVGGGFKIAMTILNNGRFGLAAGCVGGSKRLIREAAAYANQREQFGKKIGEFELIRKKFAEMALLTYAAESMTYMTCGLMDRGARDYAIEAAMSKVFSSEATWHIANECLQVMGGLGYSREYIFERVVRDSRINLIFEGTNEILRLFIALSGIQAPGEHLRELVSALKDPVENYGMLLTELVSRVRSRVITEELQRAAPKLKRAAVHIEDKAEAFGQAVERLLRHFGKKIIDEQMLIERVANVAIDLYAMVAVVSRATRALEQGRKHAEHEATLASVFCEQADRRIRRHLRAIEQGRKNGDEALREIADALLGAGGYLPTHPVL